MSRGGVDTNRKFSSRPRNRAILYLVNDGTFVDGRYHTSHKELTVGIQILERQ